MVSSVPKLPLPPDDPFFWERLSCICLGKIILSVAEQRIEKCLSSCIKDGVRYVSLLGKGLCAMFYPAQTVLLRRRTSASQKRIAMNKQQLASKIRGSANNMRSKIEFHEYKDYIFGVIF